MPRGRPRGCRATPCRAPTARQGAQLSVRSDNSVSHSFSCAGKRTAVPSRAGVPGSTGLGAAEPGGAWRGYPGAYFGRSLPAGQQVLLFCSALSVRRRAAGHPAGSHRLPYPREPGTDAATCPPSCELPVEPWQRPRGAGQGGTASTAGERAAGAGTAQPVKVTSCGGPQAAQGPPRLPGWVPWLLAGHRQERGQRRRWEPLPGAQQKAPAPGAALGARRSDEPRGLGALFALATALGCDTRGEDCCPRLVTSRGWWPDIPFFYFIFFFV